MRIHKENIEQNFQEMINGMTDQEAIEEANRCLYCYDAPCIKACPTHIDIPTFIKKITTNNIKGAALTIMKENPVGATCSRVCPTEELCEGACVLKDVTKPILIGMLQRFATDSVIERKMDLFHESINKTERIAIIGTGPAGLSAARQLALYGYKVDMYEKNERPGGLNRTGIVSFRLPKEIPNWEIEQIKKLGVTIYTNVEIGKDLTIHMLRKQYHAVIIAIGLGSVPSLKMEGEENLLDALSFIQETKEERYTPKVKGKKVIVIGAGNTAIDAATCAVRLGAESTKILYRRTEEDMSAYPFEYELAKQHGVHFQFLASPLSVEKNGESLLFHWLPVKLGKKDKEGRPVPTFESDKAIVEEADFIIKAIGQEKLVSWMDSQGLNHHYGIVMTDENYETNLSAVYACGDCIYEKGKTEATVVHAAMQGKEVAERIHLSFRRKEEVHG